MGNKKTQNKEIGLRIKQAREAAGTQERLAEMIDVSPQYISGVERGVVGLSVPILTHLSRILLISCDYILLGEGEQSDATSVVTRLSRLPAEHVRNAEEMLNRYMEGIALAQRNADSARQNLPEEMG